MVQRRMADMTQVPGVFRLMFHLTLLRFDAQERATHGKRGRSPAPSYRLARFTPWAVGSVRSGKASENSVQAFRFLKSRFVPEKSGMEPR